MLWLAVAVLLVIIEVLTTSAIALCISIGALAAMIAALCGCTLQIQLIVLAVAMVASLVIVPPLMKRYKSLFRTDRGAMSNMDALKGRTAVVEQFSCDYADQLPRVRIDGDCWQVRTADGSALIPGQMVKVCGHDSIILIVTKI